MVNNYHRPNTAQIYFYSLLNTLTINLRTQKHRLSLLKHIILGIIVGIILSFIISSLYPNYFLSIWGDKIACPAKTGGINLIGCIPGFVYLNELLGIIFGIIFGLIVFTVRKAKEEIEKNIKSK